LLIKLSFSGPKNDSLISKHYGEILNPHPLWHNNYHA